MFHDHIVALIKELHIEGGEVSRELPSFSLELDGTTIELTDSAPGVEFFASLGGVPQEGQEELFTKLLRANFLGQATEGARLGLDVEGKCITLSAAKPIIRSYREFRDAVEDFVNTVSFWKEELLQKAQ